VVPVVPAAVSAMDEELRLCRDVPQAPTKVEETALEEETLLPKKDLVVDVEAQEILWCFCKTTTRSKRSFNPTLSTNLARTKRLCCGDIGNVSRRDFNSRVSRLCMVLFGIIWYCLVLFGIVSL
jgi:hypothetical protein